MATITSTLDALAASVTPARGIAGPGVELRQQRPADAESLACLYLLQLSPTTTAHNLPPRRPGTGIQSVPAATFTADVLFSFHGTQAPQMLESVLTTLHRQGFAQVDDQLVPLRWMPTSWADLSAIWTMLSQPHSPCLVYQVGPFDVDPTEGPG